ncbi:MAG: beta family protein [Chloroflexi bacterium]|nr:beta family protein [Chloroflexota bacterium]
MFSYKHYIPILRWRAAEKGALQNLETEDRALITPFVELIMPQPRGDGNKTRKKTPAELLKESIDIFLKDLPAIPSELLKYWGHETFFLDVQLLDGSIRAKSLEKILGNGKQLDILLVPLLSVIPVVGFASDEQTRRVAVNFAKENKHGLCLRITESNLKEKSLASDVKAFIGNNSLDAKNIDLMVDFKIVDEQTSYEFLFKKINLIPHLEQWRTFIVASGAFPQDLSQFRDPGQYDIPRADWTLWCRLSKDLKRSPSFADYTIQHPVYLPRDSSSNPSASIRYALEDHWVILKGQGLRNKKGAGFKQYPAQAQLFVKQKEIFKGASFSFGDSYIAEKAKDINTKDTGNPMTWLRAGINHHLALVARQIASAP